MIVAATTNGMFDVETGDVLLEGREVEQVVARGDDGWAIADGGRVVLRRSREGAWDEVATLDEVGTIVVPFSADGALVGTEGAHVVRVDPAGTEHLGSFDAVPGRARWYNPASSGRPDTWSGAADGGSVFVSVHVGGLWRTDDGGETWVGVLEPDVDIHQVAAADGMVVVAAQGGFAVSHDHGDSWTWTTSGLHASYLQSLALGPDSVFVGASSGPFGDDAAVYRASPAGAAFERRSTGLPEALRPIGPNHLAVDGDRVAAVPWGATTVHLSLDGGMTWAETPHLPRVHSLAAI